MDFIKRNISLIIICFFALFFVLLFFIIKSSNDDKNIYLLLICMFNAIIPIAYVLQNKYEIDIFDQKYYFNLPILKKDIIFREILNQFISLKNIIILIEILIFLFFLERFSVTKFTLISILIFVQNLSIYFILVCTKNLFYNKNERIKFLGEFAIIINVISVFSGNSNLTISRISNYSPLHKSFFIFDNWWWWGSILILFFSIFILFNFAKKWSIK